MWQKCPLHKQQNINIVIQLTQKKTYKLKTKMKRISNLKKNKTNNSQKNNSLRQKKLNDLFTEYKKFIQQNNSY